MIGLAHLVGLKIKKRKETEQKRVKKRKEQIAAIESDPTISSAVKVLTYLTRRSAVCLLPSAVELVSTSAIFDHFRPVGAAWCGLVKCQCATR